MAWKKTINDHPRMMMLTHRKSAMMMKWWNENNDKIEKLNIILVH